jgi:hypothetical protein
MGASGRSRRRNSEVIERPPGRALDMRGFPLGSRRTSSTCTSCDLTACQVRGCHLLSGRHGEPARFRRQRLRREIHPALRCQRVSAESGFFQLRVRSAISTDAPTIPALYRPRGELAAQRDVNRSGTWPAANRRWSASSAISPPRASTSIQRARRLGGGRSDSAAAPVRLISASFRK